MSRPCGLPALSIAHYGEQNGDAMRDPEMLFELELCDGAHLKPLLTGATTTPALSSGAALSARRTTAFTASFPAAHGLCQGMGP